MKNKILIGICIVLVLVAIYKVTFLLRLEKNITTNSPSHKNTLFAEKYDDEPVFKDYKVVSQSAWTQPSNPEVIKKSEVINSNNEYSDIWKKWPTFKEDLDKQKLEKKYYDFFNSTGNLPIKSKDADINADGVKDKLFQSIGVGCASCHAQLVDIFVNDKIYSTYTYDGDIVPRKDQKGFYISYVQGEANAHSIIIRRFEWNGNGFTEVARKVMLLKK